MRIVGGTTRLIEGYCEVTVFTTPMVIRKVPAQCTLENVIQNDEHNSTWSNIGQNSKGGSVTRPCVNIKSVLALCMTRHEIKTDRHNTTSGGDVTLSQRRQRSGLVQFGAAT